MWKYSIKLSCLDMKSTPKHRSTLYCGNGLWNFPWCLQGFGDFLGGWRIFVLDTPPKTSIFGHFKGQGWSAVSWWGYGRAIDLSEGQDHIPYMVRHVLLEGHGWSHDDPGSRHCLFHSGLISPWSNIKSMPALFKAVIFQKFTKSKKKMLWKSRETVTSMGTGKNILLNC